MQEILFKTGVPSYVTNIITPIPTTAQRAIPIAKNIPQQVGLIYGLATYTDTVDPNNVNLITFANAQELYLNLKDGPTEFFQTVRLDALIFPLAGFPNQNPDTYMKVNIPGNFDMSTSNYLNPGGITAEAAATNIMLQLWFISTESYIWLMKKGYLDDTYAQQFIDSKR